ncbi:OmpA family protein [Massilia sp. S19_KUP03_FR1]|uniref:OmpA family protein n=1 Tax=Massilia sp. S19_KUP03_FR1 TaxID=3025503 RepID=UPI002FCDA672
MKIKTLFSLCFVAASIPALAQEAPLLAEGKVTQDSLIDALTPAPAPLRTRSIRVLRDSAPAAPARRASASLLITFETNSAELTAQAKRALDVVGGALGSDKLASFRFGIEGYADPRGQSARNLKLSQMRAESVRDYLVAAHHIDRARLEPVGKGDVDVLNKSDLSAPENRRVTLVNLSQ